MTLTYLICPPGYEVRAADVPVVQARVAADGSWRITCPHCRRTHRHSAGPGPRLAHCHPGGFAGYDVEAP